MLKVKLSSSSNIKELFAQTPGSKGIYGNCEFVFGDDVKECDYWVVLYELSKNESALCPPENTVFITGEPITVKKYNQKFLRQFASVVTSQELLKHPHVIHTHHILPWFVQKTYDELNSMELQEKSKLISVVSSNKRFSKGHEQRYQFALALKNYFGDKIDLYGRGIHDFDNKWDVIAPYNYTIAIENFNSKDYITEKLADCYLSYTFPFYYGCTNLCDYYPKGSYEYIDITDIEGSISVIDKVLHDPSHYQLHFDKICEARRRYLHEYQVFPNIANIVDSLECEDKTEPKELILKSAGKSVSDYWFKVRCLQSIVKNKLNKL